MSRRQKLAYEDRLKSPAIAYTWAKTKSCKALQARLAAVPQDLKRRIVTVDETWIHQYTSETKE